MCCFCNQSISAEKATGCVSRRLNSKCKNKANRKRYHLSKEAEVKQLRGLRRHYYIKNYPELGQIGMHARIALKHFNEENVAQGGVEYELVEKQKQKINSRFCNRWMHVTSKPSLKMLLILTRYSFSVKYKSQWEVMSSSVVS
ncbi:hypothetical protein Droror1_Dr00012894 [Drosera rotundifolia]